MDADIDDYSDNDEDYESDEDEYNAYEETDEERNEDEDKEDDSSDSDSEEAERIIHNNTINLAIEKAKKRMIRGLTVMDFTNIVIETTTLYIEGSSELIDIDYLKTKYNIDLLAYHRGKINTNTHMLGLITVMLGKQSINIKKDKDMIDTRTYLQDIKTFLEILKGLLMDLYHQSLYDIQQLEEMIPTMLRRIDESDITDEEIDEYKQMLKSYNLHVMGNIDEEDQIS